MRKILGVGVATAATPIAIAALFSTLTVLGVGWFTDKTWDLVVTSIYAYTLVSAPMALVLSLLVGVPLGNRIAKRGKPRPLAFLILGAAIGALPFLLFDVYVIVFDLQRAVRLGIPDRFWGLGPTMGRLASGIPVAMYWLGLGSWCGAWSALAYWSVAYRGSPSHFGMEPAAADAPAAGRSSGA